MSISTRFRAAAVCAVWSTAAFGQQAALDKLVDRIVTQEHAFIDGLKTRTPLLEIYIQETSSSDHLTSTGDHYFLGRVGLAGRLTYTPIAPRPVDSKEAKAAAKKHLVNFFPAGFGQMMFIDMDDFNSATYGFDYVRREFLGEIRCLMFDVKPKSAGSVGKFIGRIWVDDRDFRIVRFNGTYTGSSAHSLYFHFDSWRICAGQGQWVPALIYVEETPPEGPLPKGTVPLSFKAQGRLWGYNSGNAARMDELTNILVEMDKPVSERSAPTDASPLESQRSWERQAEENVLDRLEKSGLIAPKGDVDKVLNTVVNNLIVTSNLNVEAECRVLLTTPLETLTIGHTIVISRGLVDVLPDEASLAMVLADELAHIALGHRTNTQFAFHDEMMFPDDELVQRFRFVRTPEEIASAEKKALEILRKSPYKDNMANAGLFLRALASRAPQFPNLIRANIGNRLASGDAVVRMNELVLQAPKLEEGKLEQIAALPLGSRIKLDPWTNTIAMIKTKPVSLLSAREKMFFEIAPFAPYLTRKPEAAATETTPTQ